MKCGLCSKIIENYNPTFHHFKIDEINSLDVCDSCSEKFAKWYGNVIRSLFPTKAVKKRFAK